MTTIAVDGKSIAADGRARNSWGGIVSESVQKIIVKGRTIYAVAGSKALVEPLIKWYESGHDPGNLPVCTDDRGWSLLVIYKAGCALFTRIAPYPELVEMPFALGTGTDYALGAMRAGASAAEAVRIACELDSGSGGEIQVIDIADALGLDKPLLEAAE